MTILVSLTCNAGIVFAADSATTVTYQNGIQNVYSNGEKLFQIVKDAPFMAMITGDAYLGEVPLAEFIRWLRNEISIEGGVYYIAREDLSIDTVTKIYIRAINEYVTKTEGFSCGGTKIYIAGYENIITSLNAFGHVNTITIETNGNPILNLNIGNTNGSNINWDGEITSLYQLILGKPINFDGILIESGIEQLKINEINARIGSCINNSFLDAKMPIGDAIERAEYFVDVAKGWSRICAGHSSIGGETDVAVITKHQGFKWIKRKHFYKNKYN